jgi:hypothetical protein
MINFPSNPTVGQTYQFNDIYYVFDGEKWDSDPANQVGTLTIVEVPDAVVELDASYHGYLLVLTNGGDVQVNVNEALDANGNVVTGALVFLRYDGDGVCDLVTQVGVDLFSSRYPQFAAKYSTVALISNNQTQWTATGDLLEA